MTEENLPADTGPLLSIEEAMSEATIKQAAAMAASGATKYKVQKLLRLSQYQVSRIWKDEQFKKLLADIGDEAVLNAKATTKADLARLAKKAVMALEANLDKKNLQAAIVVLRSLGLETSKDDDNKEGGFTLVLAGQKAEPQTVRVVREGEDE